MPPAPTRTERRTLDRLLRRSAVLPALLLLSASAAFAQATSEPPRPPLDDASWSLFQRVFGMVLKDYVEPKTPQDLVSGALQGAAASAGPECAYVPPEGVAAYRAAVAEASGLPIYVTKESDFARLIAPFPGQDPALKPGDALRFIGGRATYDITYPQVVQALHGKSGEAVSCIFIKPETWQSYTVALKRQPPVAPRWIPLGEAGGALVLPCLEADLPAAEANVLRSAKGPVLIDLRGCASDDARLALRWAGELLGPVQSPVRKGPKGPVRDALSGPGLLSRKAIRVLMDGTTARAGEVLTLALVGSGAVLVGSPTFGFAPYSQELPLENGGLLRLNTAYFLTPGGEPMKGHALNPAIAFVPAPGAKPEEVYRQALKAQLPKAPSGKAETPEGNHAR